MGLVTVLRTLWRFRLAVIAVGLLAIALGVSVAYRITPPGTFESKQYNVALGSVNALVDSPSSQVVDLGGADTVGADIGALTARATLLASVMTSSPIKDEIAQRAGLSPLQLIAISPAVSSPVPGAAPVQQIVIPKRADVYVLRATVPSLDSGQVPMLTVQTQAPDPKSASRLANASIEVLQKHLVDIATTDRVPNERRLTVRQLGPATAEVQTRGPKPMTAAAVAIFVFLFGCGTIVSLVALAGGWRAANHVDWAPEPVPYDYAFNGHVNGSGNGHAYVHEPEPPVAADEPYDAEETAPVAGDDEPSHPARDNWASR